MVQSLQLILQQETQFNNQKKKKKRILKKEQKKIFILNLFVLHFLLFLELFIILLIKTLQINFDTKMQDEFSKEE